MSIFAIKGMCALCITLKKQYYHHCLWQSTTPSPYRTSISLPNNADQTTSCEKLLWDVGSGKPFAVQPMSAPAAETKGYDHV